MFVFFCDLVWLNCGSIVGNFRYNTTIKFTVDGEKSKCLEAGDRLGQIFAEVTVTNAWRCTSPIEKSLEVYDRWIELRLLFSLLRIHKRGDRGRSDG